MKRLMLGLLICAIPSLAGPEQQDHNLDFEDGLRGWVATGSAFHSQPSRGNDFQTDRFKAVSLGGNYWRGLPYPVGQHGDFFIFSYEPGGDALTGTLTSEDIQLSRHDRYCSFLIGGTRDIENERLELQVKRGSASESDQLDQLLIRWEFATRESKLRSLDIRSGLPIHDGDYLVLARATGHLGEMLRQEVIELPDFIADRTVRIKIIDSSSKGHISVDHIQFTSTPPPPQSTPVWGLADYHTHPMTHMAYGALKGAKTLWGVPGGAFNDYQQNRVSIAQDIPHCVDNHGGGPTAEVFINVVEKRLNLDGLGYFVNWFTGNLTQHGRSGGPEFLNFPTFLSGAHEQMHITQIHRAWEGGLRLITAFAINNKGAEFLASKVENGRVYLTSDLAVLKAQICGIRQLVELNSDWMEIAYDPAKARDIIRRGKLAVVLGVELDETGELLENKSRSGNSRAEEEVNYLWSLGVRHVIPIHAANNRLGGAAVFEPAYNSLNDILHGSFFDLREGGCSRGPLVHQWGECVMYRMEDHQNRVIISRKPLPNWPPFQKKPFVSTVPVKKYKAFDGDMNEQGLTSDGNTYIKELMKRGMLLDLAHMSQRSVENTYGVLAERLVNQGHSECSRLGDKVDLPSACYELAYPLVASHAHFRGLSIQDRCKTTVQGFLPEEYEIGEHELELIHRTGGVVGPFVSEDPVDPPSDVQASFKNDCASSSKSFGYSYLYGLHKLNGEGVGLATDFTFITGASPRFGPNACWAYHEADHPRRELSKMPEQYDFRAQQDGVDYEGFPAAKGVTTGHKPQLEPYWMGSRRYDFNVDGFAHYGMLPDFLQDLRNLGFREKEFTALFSSAEFYLRTWEKAELVAGIGGDGQFQPEYLNCGVVCKGLCPTSGNAGPP